MRFSTVSRKANQDSTTGLFVALYLILLAFFIILTKDLSFNDYKQTIAMRSLQETFGRPKEQSIMFGRLADVKIDEFSLQIEKLIKDYGQIATSSNEDRLKVIIPLEAIYYSDEKDFRNEKIDDMMRLTSIIKRWANIENMRISVRLGETNIAQDNDRLEFFEKRTFGESHMVGISTNSKNLEINIERNI